MSDTVIGFVGIGRMGGLMGPRLMAAGHKICVFDTNAEALEDLKRKGAGLAASAQEVADRAETIFVNLPTPDIVHAVALGEKGLSGGSWVKTVIDLSTTGPGMDIGFFVVGFRC